MFAYFTKNLEHISIFTVHFCCSFFITIPITTITTLVTTTQLLAVLISIALSTANTVSVGLNGTFILTPQSTWVLQIQQQ